MIARAIFELLNVTDVTDLATGGVYYGTAPQKAQAPYIVFRESSDPEHFKNDTKVVNHSLDIVILDDKGKDGNAGFLAIEAIGSMVHSKLNRFTGMAGSKAIQTIVKDDEEVYYDQVSQTAIMEMSYNVRENMTESLANPSNLVTTVNFYVDDVLNTSQVVNGFEDNTINITV